MNKFWASIKIKPARYVWLGAMGLLLLGVYVPVLNGRFVYDDLWYIVKNPFIHLPLQNLSFFIDPRITAAPSSGLAADVYRPLTLLWFWVDAHLWGPNTIPYHLENLGLHVLNGFIFFLLLKRWMQDEKVALLGTAVVLFHPVQIQNVAWITQRSTLASTLLLLIGIYLLSSGASNPLRLSVVIGLQGLALFFRETAVIFPLLLASVLWASDTHSLRRHRMICITLLAMSALYLVLRYNVLHQWSQLPDSRQPWTHTLYLGVTAFPVYLGKLLIPIKLRVSYAYPPWSVGLLMGSLAVWGVYAAGLVWAIRRDRWIAVGLMWILTGLLPVLQLIPIRTFVAERFLYIPTFGLALILIRLASLFLAQRYVFRWLVLLILVTAYSVPAWKNENALWAAAVRAEPKNSFAQICYAATLPPKEAAERYQQTLQLDLDTELRFAAITNLSDTLLKLQRNPEALLWARKALALRPASPEALYDAGRAAARTGYPEEANAALLQLKTQLGDTAPAVGNLKAEIRNGLVVTPAKAGVQNIGLDSGFRRNDGDGK